MKKQIKTISAIAVFAVLASCSTGEQKTEAKKDAPKQKVEIATL